MRSSTSKSIAAPAISTHCSIVSVIKIPEGRALFASKSDKTRAEIHFEARDSSWIAEYKFRFLLGEFQGRTLPLSTRIKPFATQAEARRQFGNAVAVPVVAAIAKAAAAFVA